MSVISVTTSDITYSSYKVSWTDSLTILGATLTYYENGVSKGSVDVTGVSEYTVTVTEGMAFSYVLAISDADGDTNNPGSGNSVLRAPVVSGGSVVSAGSIQVNWTCDAGTESGFYVYYKGTSGGYSLGRTESADATDGTVTGLAAGDTYTFKVVAYNSFVNSDDSNETSVYIGAAYSDTVTSTCTASDAIANVLAAVESASSTCVASDSVSTAANLAVTTTDTVTVSDYAAASQTIKLDFGYYWGTEDGYVHEFAPEYASDNGTSITAYWTSKTMDFAEDDSENTGKWKTIYQIEHVFKDDYADTTTIYKISTDGGSTWNTISQDVGDNGDGRMESADYFWNVTGQFFVVKIEWPSSTKTFQFFGFDVTYDTQGDEYGVV